MRARVPVPAPDAAWRRESCGACAMFREYPHEVRRLAHDGLCLLAGEEWRAV